jgi:transposase
VSLVEVAPKTRESGKKVAKGHIASGRFYVRKALYMTALVAAFSNNKMRKIWRVV